MFLWCPFFLLRCFGSTCFFIKNLLCFSSYSSFFLGLLVRLWKEHAEPNVLILIPLLHLLLPSQFRHPSGWQRVLGQIERNIHRGVVQLVDNWRAKPGRFGRCLVLFCSGKVVRLASMCFKFSICCTYCRVRTQFSSQLPCRHYSNKAVHYLINEAAILLSYAIINAVSSFVQCLQRRYSLIMCSRMGLTGYNVSPAGVDSFQTTFNRALSCCRRSPANLSTAYLLGSSSYSLGCDGQPLVFGPSPGLASDVGVL